MYRIDLNADMGEGFGAYRLGNDEELLNYVTSANIACGFHAGDPGTMRQTVRMALEKGVAIGAHPGLPDRVGFGRRKMEITPREAYEMVLYQIGALSSFVKAEGGAMQHVKPHGALYNMAAKNEELARAIAEAVYRVDPGLILFGLSGSKLTKAGESIGLRTAHEVFADRTYREDGSLTPRSLPGALIAAPEAAARQAIRMVKEGKVTSLQGREIDIKADTICVHGDNPHALAVARTIRESLTASQIVVLSIGANPAV
ncbi:LamB/YcsF family protein [Thermicanus aegyptius]|uniref:LamB/YcsF family protein n=1 Tax=Thermicanus aegyptius TaxID=94009 RepID=UPI000425ECB9|nr:5-oxoprolinase subunit PxpA [Thermicanus aegyptius]